MTAKFERKAIRRIEEMVMAVTIHVLPKYKHNSVIAFVSNSMNPAPKRKYAG